MTRQPGLAHAQAQAYLGSSDSKSIPTSGPSLASCLCSYMILMSYLFISKPKVNVDALRLSFKHFS